MQYLPSSVTALGQRLIALAGPLASAAQGLVGLGMLRRTPLNTAPGGAWYFWWLLGHGGLFTAAGYLLALSFAPFGDVHKVVQGLSAEPLWRTLATVLGTFIAYRSMVHAARTLAPHLPPAPARRPVLARLTLIPYLLGGLASVLVTALGTHDQFLTLASAGAASFGSGVLLVWLNFVLPRLRRAPEAGALLTLEHDRSWLVAGVAALIVWTLLGRAA